MKPGDRPFVVGRKTAKGTTVVLLRSKPQGPQKPRIQGPWTVRAVVGK